MTIQLSILKNRFAIVVFHIVGVGCLSGSVALEFIAFFSIYFRGAFLGVEHNRWILNSEIGVTIFCAVYVISLARAAILSVVNVLAKR